MDPRSPERISELGRKLCPEGLDLLFLGGDLGGELGGGALVLCGEPVAFRLLGRELSLNPSGRLRIGQLSFGLLNYSVPACSFMAEPGPTASPENT